MPPPTKKEQFQQLPRSYRQFQYANTDILREATALKELPSILMPTNDRRMLPPLVHYGYALPIERMDELLEQKLDFPPHVLDIDPFNVLFHLQDEVFFYRIKFQTVYLRGTDSMLFIAIGSNWKPSQANQLEGVIKRLQDFLEVDEEPVWCLDSSEYYWRK